MRAFALLVAGHALAASESSYRRVRA